MICRTKLRRHSVEIAEFTLNTLFQTFKLTYSVLHSVEKWKIYSDRKNISSNQLFSNFFTRNFTFTKYLTEKSKLAFSVTPTGNFFRQFISLVLSYSILYEKYLIILMPNSVALTNFSWNQCKSSKFINFLILRETDVHLRSLTSFFREIEVVLL